MILTSIIIDHDLKHIENLKKYEDLLPFLKITACFTNISNAINYLNQNDIDVIFTDLQYLNYHENPNNQSYIGQAEIILSLDHPMFEFNSHCLSAIDYILKPVSFEKFSKALSKVYHKKMEQKPKVQEFSSSNSDFFFVKNNSLIEKVLYNDILFFKGLKDYIWIQTTDKKIITLQTMKNICKTLPLNKFARIHKSYIVSLEQIEYIERNRVVIGNNRIPIGEK